MYPFVRGRVDEDWEFILVTAARAQQVLDGHPGLTFNERAFVNDAIIRLRHLKFIALKHGDKKGAEKIDKIENAFMRLLHGQISEKQFVNSLVRIAGASAPKEYIAKFNAWLEHQEKMKRQAERVRKRGVFDLSMFMPRLR